MAWQVRNLVDARTLRDLDAFPAEVLSADEFKRPSKDVVQAAHEVGRRKNRRQLLIRVVLLSDSCAIGLLMDGKTLY